MTSHARTTAFRSLPKLLAPVTVIALAACSDRQPESATNPPAALVSAVPAQSSQSAAEAQVVERDLIAAGIATTYRATFAAGQLTRIAETRKPAGAGEYVFQGARLLQYSGAALGAAQNIELRFSLQGMLESAQGSAGAVTDAEIAAIRTRAQLLRSHALAQTSTRGHTDAY